ncbi:MAG: hypothetical protein NC309_13015, partial [Ruminococcus sp.]|nr:hypothetical protein [Ruminococcus sp.]
MRNVRKRLRKIMVVLISVVLILVSVPWTEPIAAYAKENADLLEEGEMQENISGNTVENTEETKTPQTMTEEQEPKGENGSGAQETSVANGNETQQGKTEEPKGENGSAAQETGTEGGNETQQGKTEE